jgi:hypothetical protein
VDALLLGVFGLLDSGEDILLGLEGLLGCCGDGVGCLWRDSMLIRSRYVSKDFRRVLETYTQRTNAVSSGEVGCPTRIERSL